MSDRMLDLLARLDAIPGVSGDERLVADVVIEELDGAYDEHDSDALGNHYFVRKAGDGAPTVMLCAHMDELGFIVQHVEDEGFVRMAPIGYHDDRMVVDQHLIIHGDEGPVLGISGAKPNHLLEAAEREKPFKLNELAVDLGTTSREETEALGVRVGHMITFAREGALLNGTRVFTGKAVDDRAGCAVMIEVMRRLSSRSATVVRRGGRPGGARHPRGRPGRLPGAAGRRAGDRRHAVRRRAGGRLRPCADQAGRRPRDQVLRLGARGADRQRGAAAADQPPRASRGRRRRHATSARY